MSKAYTNVVLPYGRTTIEVSVPTHNLMAVISPNEVAPKADLVTLLQEALRNPIGVPPFSQSLREGAKLLILVDDITRPTPTDKILPVLLDELEVERKKIETTILIALGTHRDMTQEEIEARVGLEIATRYPVLNQRQWKRRHVCRIQLAENPTNEYGPQTKDHKQSSAGHTLTG